MLVDYPFEWNKYMVPGKVRTFKKETPADVLEEAKKIYLLNRSLDNAKKLADDVNSYVEKDVVVPMELADYVKLEKKKYNVIQTTSKGMYPDVDLGRIHTAGNSSLDGARMLLLDRRILDELDEILELMSYVQFGAVEDFVHKMVAASALPHTDLERYPTVAARLEEHKKWRI